MLEELTTRQRQVLETIERLIAINHRSPSIHELMAEMHIASPNGVAKHLIALETKGHIIREQGARGIRLTKQVSVAASHNLAYVPLIGTIAAGAPILADENVEDVLPMPESVAGSDGETFFLRVKGESMIEEGILPGDLVMIKRCDIVSNGELAAVLVEDEATVKRFFKRDGKIILEPANRYFEPIVIEPGAENVAIVGKVVGLMRSYGRKL